MWIKGVVAAALACSPVAEVVGVVSALKALEANAAWRRESNQDLQEAQQFMAGLLERVVAWQGYRLEGAIAASAHLPEKDIFIRTEPPGIVDVGDDFEANRTQRALQKNNMVEYWRAIFTRSDISSTWLVRKLQEHIASGRLHSIRQKRTETARGWLISHEVVVAYMRARTVGTADDLTTMTA